MCWGYELPGWAGLRIDDRNRYRGGQVAEGKDVRKKEGAICENDAYKLVEEELDGHSVTDRHGTGWNG